MANMTYITQCAEALIKRYDTRDPFELCRELDIRIWYKDLGNDIQAYFFYQSRIKNIVINQHTSSISQKILCAHELGHGLLHKELAAMRGFHEATFFDSTSRAEYEANLFAAELLIDDNELLERLSGEEQSLFDLAKGLYVPAELLDFKFRILKSKGCQLEAPYIAQADFLKRRLPYGFD